MSNVLLFCVLWLALGVIFATLTLTDLPPREGESDILYFAEGVLAWPIRLLHWYIFFFFGD
jgi:hypothetical protein